MEEDGEVPGEELQQGGVEAVVCQAADGGDEGVAGGFGGVKLVGEEDGFGEVAHARAGGGVPADGLEDSGVVLAPLLKEMRGEGAVEEDGGLLLDGEDGDVLAAGAVEEVAGREGAEEVVGDDGVVDEVGIEAVAAGEGVGLVSDADDVVAEALGQFVEFLEEALERAGHWS